MKHWTKEEDIKLLELYKRRKSIREISTILKRTENAIRNKLYKLNVSNKKFLTNNELKYIKDNYKSYNLKEIAKELGRTKPYICRIAKKLGLELTKRKKETLKPKTKYKNEEERAKAHSKTMKEWHKNHEHPKGMLNKHHSKEYCKKISERVKKYWQDTDKNTIENSITKSIETRKKNGTLNPMKYLKNPYSRTKSGKRKDLADKFFRSSWEANYARYLDYMNIKWDYEPKTFYFEGIKRGCLSYTPDFYLQETNEWIEVKGWMDDKSKTKLKRFAKYYPNEKLKLIGEKEYKEIEKKYKKIIPYWE